MALVEKLEPYTLKTPAAQKAVRCTFSIVTEKDGTRMLQLDTYGTTGRKLKDKRSQSMRFSTQALSQLLAVIREYDLAK
jgi:hypothetical protein